MSQEFYNKDDDKVIDIDMEKLKKSVLVVLYHL